MATKLLYLEDFDVTACEAQVVEVRSADDGRTIVVLDQTCFYPRGGGQDWDTGTINDFAVEEVRLDETGTVLHIGTPAVDWPAGTQVRCQVDADRRSINTRLHSAGHVVDMAMQQIEPGWIPGKGGHYPHMSFVEYDVGDVQLDEQLQPKLQAGIGQLLKSDYQNNIKFVPIAEMAKYCRHVPSNIPTNKPSRIVLYADDFGIPCGGTHVKKVSDIGKLHITKIKIKKGVAKVSYAIDGIN
jgi:Ser-tRNA(Ala) deacylase AlaX